MTSNVKVQNTYVHNNLCREKILAFTEYRENNLSDIHDLFTGLHLGQGMKRESLQWRRMFFCSSTYALLVFFTMTIYLYITRVIKHTPKCCHMVEVSTKPERTLVLGAELWSSYHHYPRARGPWAGNQLFLLCFLAGWTTLASSGCSEDCSIWHLGVLSLRCLCACPCSFLPNITKIILQGPAHIPIFTVKSTIAWKLEFTVSSPILSELSTFIFLKVYITFYLTFAVSLPSNLQSWAQRPYYSTLNCQVALSILRFIKTVYLGREEDREGKRFSKLKSVQIWKSS